EQAIREPAHGSADRHRLAEAQNALAWTYVELGRNLDRALELSLESNERVLAEPEEIRKRVQPVYLDTLGYTPAPAGRCREAGDAMGRAASIQPAYQARRGEVARACAAGERP